MEFRSVSKQSEKCKSKFNLIQEPCSLETLPLSLSFPEHVQNMSEHARTRPEHVGTCSGALISSANTNRNFTFPFVVKTRHLMYQLHYYRMTNDINVLIKTRYLSMILINKDMGFFLVNDMQTPPPIPKFS